MVGDWITAINATLGRKILGGGVRGHEVPRLMLRVNSGADRERKEVREGRVTEGGEEY